MHFSVAVIRDSWLPFNYNGKYKRYCYWTTGVIKYIRRCRTPIDRENGMNTMEQQIITFDNPPIDEILCSIHFNSITGLQAGHLGLLWDKYRPDFSTTKDQNLLVPVSEEDLINRDAPPLPRVWFEHKDENELIQMQFNRFAYNWRKRRPDDKYPGYEKFMENFEEYLSRFQDFLTEEQLGDFAPIQYELAYIDHILENEGWETINDLEKVFPSFISYKGQNMLPPNIREINYQMAFSLTDDSGGLQLSIRNARRLSDDRHLLRVEFRAISNQPYSEMRKWFDSAHEVILNVFVNLVSDEIQENYWGRKS